MRLLVTLVTLGAAALTVRAAPQPQAPTGHVARVSAPVGTVLVVVNGQAKVITVPRRTGTVILYR